MLVEIDLILPDGAFDKAKLILTQRQFEMFEAYYIRNLPVQEIARQMSLTANSVYKTLARARLRIRNDWRCDE